MPTRSFSICSLEIVKIIFEELKYLSITACFGLASTFDSNMFFFIASLVKTTRRPTVIFDFTNEVSLTLFEELVDFTHTFALRCHGHSSRKLTLIERVYLSRTERLVLFSCYKFDDMSHNHTYQCTTITYIETLNTKQDYTVLHRAPPPKPLVREDERHERNVLME